jgi:hypothetical protein
VRKDQDLAGENQRLDKNLIEAFSRPPNQRNLNQEAAVRKHLDEIADTRADVGRLLAQRFPDYVALSKPQPLAVKDVSGLLTDEEALVLIDLGKRKVDASYIWVVAESSVFCICQPFCSLNCGRGIQQRIFSSFMTCCLRSCLIRALPMTIARNLG